MNSYIKMSSIAAMATAVILASVVVIIPQASADNPCEHSFKRNPNCFVPRTCNDPSICAVLQPPGNKP